MVRGFIKAGRAGRPAKVAEREYWISVDGSKMMRDTFRAFLNELRAKGAKLEGYQSSRRIYIKCTGSAAVIKAIDDSMSGWVYYQPVSICKTKPKISDYDQFELR